MAAEANLSTHKKGDTWGGLPNIQVNKDDSPLDLTDAVIRMHVRPKRTSVNYTTAWSTEDDTITISNASGGVFSVNSCVVDIPAGTYYYDIEITLSSGLVITIMEGTWVIDQDVTR